LRPEQALGAALKLLGRSALSRSQLSDRLARRGLDRAVIDETCQRLIELRLLDDAGLARRYVERESGSRGELALRHGLQRLGIDEVTAERALRGDSDGIAIEPGQQNDAAAALLRKHAWRFRPKIGEDDQNDPQTARQALERRKARAARFLASRGFRTEAVAAALAAAVNDGVLSDIATEATDRHAGSPDPDATA
jgi:SOS response regulatory protein OraA/RecX